MSIPVLNRSPYPVLLSLVLVALLLGVPSREARAQPGTLRGQVVDSAGRPMRDVEVISINSKRSTRTGRDGRFILTRLPFGQQLVMARLPGFRAGQEVVNMLDENTPPVTFTLGRVVQVIDTVRITSHDGCAAYDFEGYECRRRAGIGQFRSAEEIKALRPDYWADMFEGLPGLRRESYFNPIIGRDWTVAATTGWRCLAEGWNGRHKTAADERVMPEDIVAIEHYDLYEKVPAAYKRLAWPRDQEKPCALVMYWTRGFIENQKRP